MRKRLRTADVILIGGLLLLSGLPLIGGGAGDRVVIQHGGAVIYDGEISAEERIAIDGKYHNVIVIAEGQVYMEASDCPGGDCVRQGAISRAGSRIACAPNGVIVTVRGAAEESGVDAVAG